MTPESLRELEGLVDQLRALVPRLRDQNQTFAKQLVEMAVLELRTCIYQIDDEELQALCSNLSESGGRFRAEGWGGSAEPLSTRESVEIMRSARSLASAGASGSPLHRPKRERQN
jgi:hypothetical protein